MKRIIILLLLIILLTQTPYIIGIRDFHQTIIDFFLAILVYIPLGIWLEKRMKKESSKD